MTLIGAILKKVQSKDSVFSKKYASPPPELDEASIERRICRKKRKPIDRYPHAVAKVDTSPPRLDVANIGRHLGEWHRQTSTIFMENVKLVIEIKRQHFRRGKVDSHWAHSRKPITEHYEKRRDFLKRVQADNKVIHERIITTKARVVPTQSLEHDWQHYRQKIVEMAKLPFVLFPPDPQKEVDSSFEAPPGINRPRIQMHLRVEGGASIGSLTIELFTDVCPRTCQLFCELAAGDSGHGYVGTSFFRKVPYLYWSGGDVIYDNGFGCYAQVGHHVPIGAENYHFPHSMPGLLSMRMTKYDEMCGIFNITFKPLPQFDLKNVVFGRVVRPNSTYSIIRSFGSPLSTQPVVRITALRERTRMRKL